MYTRGAISCRDMNGLVYGGACTSGPLFIFGILQYYFLVNEQLLSSSNHYLLHSLWACITTLAVKQKFLG